MVNGHTKHLIPRIGVDMFCVVIMRSHLLQERPSPSVRYLSLIKRSWMSWSFLLRPQEIISETWRWQTSKMISRSSCHHWPSWVLETGTIIFNFCQEHIFLFLDQLYTPTSWKEPLPKSTTQNTFMFCQRWTAHHRRAPSKLRVYFKVCLDVFIARNSLHSRLKVQDVAGQWILTPYCFLGPHHWDCTM